MRKAILPIFLPHLGCPHQCVFCNQHAIAGETVTRDMVQSRIAAGLKKCAPEIPQVAFYGGSFTALPAQLQEGYLSAVKPYLDRGEVSGIRVSTRPDAIDEEVIQRLCAARVDTVELGAQSMEEEALKASGRGHAAEDTVRAVNMLKSAGIAVVLQMMVGLPEERDPLYTARELIALAPCAVRIYPVAVVAKTPLEILWKEGKYRPLSISEGVSICAKLSELFEMHGIPIIRMGLNPSAELDRTVLAGVYHPAFGELVQSERYYEKAKRLLNGVQGSVILRVHPSRISCMVGQKKQNLLRLREEYGLNLCVKAGEVRDGEIQIERASRTS